MHVYRRYGARVRAALFGAALAGYVLAVGLASSPQLHDLFHHDAEQRQHVCLATTLHTGQAAPTAVVVLAVEPAAAPATKVAPTDVESAESFFLRCRLLEHGPPASC